MAHDLSNINIRAIDINGSPGFPVKDVCDVLGVDNCLEMKLRLRASEQQYVSRSNVDCISVSFPNRGMTFVSESAVYKLVMLSGKPEAEAFQVWVSDAVSFNHGRRKGVWHQKRTNRRTQGQHTR